MGLTNAFRDWLPSAITGVGSPTLFTNGASYIGVGDSSTAFAAGQTDLQAATNKMRKGMEATYPQISTNTMTFRCLLGTGDANHAIEEWGVFNASSSGTMMCRKAESRGTKVSGDTWQITATITLTLA